MIYMVIVWYDRNQKTAEPIYSESHNATVSGETPVECMKAFLDLERNHDMDKYTRMHIAGIY